MPPAGAGEAISWPHLLSTTPRRDRPMNEKQLDTELLPYPLPPWKHRFRTLSIFCEVDEAALSTRVPAPLELASNVVQITVMHFESTVPPRPYYDSAVIAQVRYTGARSAGTGCTPSPAPTRCARERASSGASA